MRLQAEGGIDVTSFIGHTLLNQSDEAPMPKKRLDPPEPRATPTDHWALFGLLAGVRRSLERKHQDPEQGPHEPARPATPMKGKPPER